MSEGYKVMEIGDIPRSWNLVQVESLLLNKKGAMKIGPFGSQLKKETFVENGIKVYGQENIFERSMEFGSRYITTEHFEALKSCELFEGDFIISMMGTIGKCMVVPTGIKKGIMDSHLLRLQLNNSKVLTDFLSQLFGSPIILNQVKKLAVGGIMAGLSSKIVHELKFPLPPLLEQQKIASILSVVDEKIEVIDAQISQTQELKKGLMQQLLSKGIGHTKFKSSEMGDIPESWEVVRLGDVTSLFAGGTPLRGNKEYYENGSLYWIKSGEVNQRNIFHSEEKITEKAITESSARRIRANSVLVALYGATAGNVGRLRVDASSNQAVLAINSRFSDLSNDFIYCVLKHSTSKLLGLTQGSGQPNLSKGILDSLKISLPPTEEQQHIAEILETVDDKVEVLYAKRRTYQQLKRGLMQQLLTGKIRVNTSHNEPALA